MGFEDDDRHLYALVVSGTAVGFAVTFILSWFVSARWFHPDVFNRLDAALKADWCSRVNSTIHGVVVVIGFIATLAQTGWSNELRPEYSAHLRNVRCFMAVSLGYFAADFFVVAGFRVPLFYVFIVHHIVASLPFYLHLFVSDCDFGTLALASFLCVEFATVFLNIQSWCETIVGHKSTAMYKALFVATYVAWGVSRVGLPAFCMAIWYKYVLVHDFRTTVPLGCLVPMTVCGHIILLFCFAVFLFVLTPELVAIIRGDDPVSRVVSRATSRVQSKVASAIGRRTWNEPIDEEMDADGAVIIRDSSATTDEADSEPVAENELPPHLQAAHLGDVTSIHDIVEQSPSIRASLSAHT